MKQDKQGGYNHVAREKINHISCEVKDCVYHDKMDCCNAAIINVTPRDYGEADTACATYEQQEDLL